MPFLRGLLCVPNEPLRFDQLYCALGSVAITSGQHYWEVDVHCCPSWLWRGLWQPTEERTGQRCQTWTEQVLVESWVSERASLGLAQRSTCGTTRHSSSGSTKQSRGVFKVSEGPSVFYDAETMRTLQEFSAVQTAVFERAHHQFTEPLYPAFRFFFTQRQRPSSYENMQSQSLLLLAIIKTIKLINIFISSRNLL